VLENGQLLTLGSSFAGQSLGRILVSCMEVLEGGRTSHVPYYLDQWKLIHRLAPGDTITDPLTKGL
jgi:hypothetical protein